MANSDWPNFFIVGAAKSGTTSLYEYLKASPGVFMSPVKEPHYFTSELGPASKFYYCVRAEDEYLRLFKNSRFFQASGEASPSYLWDEQVPQKIHSTCPDARIIIMLRNPIDRAYSHYLMDLRYGWEKHVSFYDAIISDYNSRTKGWWFSHLYVELGQYYSQVKRYIDTFGIHRVKIIIFEQDFVRNPSEATSDIIKFLDIKSAVPQAVFNKKYMSRPSEKFLLPKSRYAWNLIRFIGKIRNKNKAAFSVSRSISHDKQEQLLEMLFLKKGEKPKMNMDAIAFLKKIYKEDVEKLQILIGRQLPWKFP